MMNARLFKLFSLKLLTKFDFVKHCNFDFLTKTCGKTVLLDLYFYKSRDH